MDPLHILIVEDDENDVILLQKELRSGGLVFESKVVDTHADFVKALDESVPDLIIADFQLPRFDALTALELSQHKTRRTPFIIFTGCLDEPTAVLCMKLGAWDYVLKQNPVRLVACIRSALERRRLVEEREQAVREGEQRFRQIADVAPVLIWMTDPAGVFHYFNRAWLDFTGRTESEERNGGWLDSIHPADRTRCEQMMQSKIETLQACQIEFRLKRHDGAFRWILCNGTPYYSGKDRFSGYIGSGVDITEVRDAEAEKGHGHELATALIETLPGPAYAKDSSGRYIVVNHQGSLLLGRGKDAFRGKSNAQLGLDTEFASLESREVAALRSGVVSKGDLDSALPESRFTIVPWGSGQDGPTGILAFEAQKQGVTVSSTTRHDMNNFVAIIRMYSEYLEEQAALPESTKSKVRQILEASEKLGAIISGLSAQAEAERSRQR